eukprot:contig_4765_g1029
MSILRFGVQMYFSSLSPRGGRPVASGNAYIRPLDSTSEEQYLVKFGASKACGSGGPVIVILFEDTLGVLADPAKYMPEMYVLTPKGDDRGAYGYEHESEEESGEEEGTEEAEEASAGVAGVAVDVDAKFEMADADEPAPVPRRLSFAQRRITPSTRSDRQVMSLAWDQHWAAGKFLPNSAGTPTPSPTRWGCGTPSGGSSKFGWVANTGQHHRRSWLEWFNILTLGALLSGIAWRLFAFIVIEEACSPYENFGAVAFGGYVAWMMAPVALVSLNERLSSADESGREGKPMPVPTPIIAAALTILGVVFLSGWANARGHHRIA